MSDKPNQIMESLERPERQVMSQATTIEQTRAIAEVKAMVSIAKASPRNVDECLREMRLSCSMRLLAEHAFYKYRRGAETVTGPTVGLMRELARCWGNITYGMAELARDDEGGQSEMLAFAWDLERNVRPGQIFIVPHRRDRSEDKGGPILLTSMRDIYENNTNQAARRLREQIENALPIWFVKEAVELCHKTLEAGDGSPVPARVAIMLKSFADMGVSRERIEAKLGSKAEGFTALDLARLGVSYRSIRREEINAAEEFPELTAGKIQKELEGPTKESTDETPKPKRTRKAKEQERAPDVGAPAPAGDDARDGEPAGETSPSQPPGENGSANGDEPSVGQILQAGIKKLGLIIDLGSTSFEALDAQVRRDLAGMVSLKRQWQEAVTARGAEIDRLNTK